EHADAAQALLPDFPGNRLGGHGIVEDHAPVAGIALLDDLQDEVLLSWGIEESIADPRADPLAGDVGTVDGGRSGRRWIHRRGHRASLDATFTFARGTWRARLETLVQAVT